MSFDFFNGMPGITDIYQTAEKELLWGPWQRGMHQFASVVIVSTAADANNTPTTTLRKGLAMGIVTSTLKWSTHLPTATTGPEIARGILMHDVNMLNPKSGSAEDKNALVLIGGPVKNAGIPNISYLVRQQLSHRFIFDDDLLGNRCWFPNTIVKTTNYTVTVAENNCLFETTGASGAVTFTLPAVQRGLSFSFFNTVDQNMAITAPANTLVGLNNATATTATFSTASQKIGAGATVVANAAGDKWLLLNRGTNTVTMS